MATVNSVQIANGSPIAGVGLGGGQIKTAYALVNVPIGTTTADVIPLFYLPPHSQVRAIKGKCGALGGSLTVSIGDAGVGTAISAVTTRYVASQSIASATTFSTLATAGLFFKNTTNQKMLVKATALSGTSDTAGTLEVAIDYVVEEPQQ